MLVRRRSFWEEAKALAGSDLALPGRQEIEALVWRGELLRSFEAAPDRLGLVPGDAVILAVVPEHRALVVINPCLFAGFAPAHVRAMLISGDDALAPVVSRALSSVVAGAQ